MSDPKILNRLRVMPVIVLDVKKPGRYVMSVSDLLKKIQKLEPSIDISPIGETDLSSPTASALPQGKFSGM